MRRKTPTLEELTETMCLSADETLELYHELRREARSHRRRPNPAQHSPDSACWAYLVEQLSRQRLRLERLLETHPDLKTLGAIVSDGTLMRARFCHVETLERIGQELADWPPEYPELFRKALQEPRRSDQLLVLGLVGNACHHYLVPRVAILGDPH